MMHLRRTARGLAIGVGLVLTLAACDWPMPGHDANRSGYNPGEATLTPDTVAGLTEAFSVPLPEGSGPPVVAAGRLLATSGRTVHGYDRRTGAPQWTYTLPDGPAGDAPTAAGPYVVGRRAAVGDLFGALYDATAMLDVTSGAQVGDLVDGAVAAARVHDVVLVNRLWTGSSGVRPVYVTVRPTDASAPVKWAGYVDVDFGGSGAYFAPTLGDGTLYGDLDGDLVAYDLDVPCPSFGTFPECPPLWRVPVQAIGPVVLSPDGATLFTGTTDGRFVAIDAATGATRWTAQGLGSVNGLPALADGRLYVPTTEHVLAFDAGGCGQSTCEPLWTTLRGSAGGQPVVGGDVLYVGAANGVVDAYDLTTSDRIDAAPVWTGHVDSGVSGGLAVAFGRLYVGTGSGVTAFALPD
jgi:outer membrane protein assembly factor BamB